MYFEFYNDAGIDKLSTNPVGLKRNQPIVCLIFPIQISGLNDPIPSGSSYCDHRAPSYPALWPPGGDSSVKYPDVCVWGLKMYPL